MRAFSGILYGEEAFKMQLIVSFCGTDKANGV